jgi:hypothetical protein
MVAQKTPLSIIHNVPSSLWETGENGMRADLLENGGRPIETLARFPLTRFGVD